MNRIITSAAATLALLIALTGSASPELVPNQLIETTHGGAGIGAE